MKTKTKKITLGTREYYNNKAFLVKFHAHINIEIK